MARWDPNEKVGGWGYRRGSGRKKDDGYGATI